MALPEIKLDFGDSFENALARRASADWYGQRARSEAAEDQRKAESQQYVEPAMRGDQQAMGRLAYGDPKAAVAISTALTRMDANQRAQTKEQAEYAANSANAVLQADPSERAAVYRTMYDQGVQRGYKMTLPPDYHPSLDGQLRAYRQAAVPIVEWFKQDQDAPKPLGPAGGALPPQGDATPYGPAGALPAGNQGRAGNAIAGIESRGQPGGGYGAVGPVADSKGSRAYGKYQVMDFNIPAWTQEILGRQMTPQEFVASPEAQEAVFAGKFGQYVQKYGSQQAAARAWFAGEGGMNNPGARDVNGMTVANYERRFSDGLGGGAPGPGVPGPVAVPPPPGGLGTAPTAPMPALSGAEGPGAPQGLIPPGPPAAQMPVPEGLPQGDSPGDGSGNPRPPSAPDAQAAQAAVRGIKLPPGARMMGVKGVPVVKDGAVYVIHADGTPDWIPLPQRKEPGPEKGLFGDSLTGRAIQVLRTTDPTSQDYAMAHSILSKPQVYIDAQTGERREIQPMDLSMFPRPGFGGAPSAGTQPPVPATSGSTTTPLASGGGTVTTTPGKGKPLDMGATIKLGGTAKSALEMRELAQTFDPSFGGYMLDTLGDAANTAKLKLPDALGGGDPKGQGQWWQRYAAISNVDRNELFGASLTPGEKEEWKKATVTPGMRPDEIRKNIERQRDIAEKGLSRIANSMLASGYNREAIESATGIRMGDLPNQMGAVPQSRGGAAPPQAAVDRLKANPGERAMFDEIFGAGASDRVLGR